MTDVMKMAGTARKLMTPEEFFDWEPGDEERYELIEGVPVRMMTGASRRHDRIVINVIAALREQLRGTNCYPASSDLALRTRPRSVRRPDVMVTCDEVRADRYDAEEPRLVVEVLSKSNAGLDWQRKLEEYRQRAGLDYILLIDSRAVGAQLLTRTDGGWEPKDFETLTEMIELPEIGCRLPMMEVYDGVIFEAPDSAI